MSDSKQQASRAVESSPSEERTKRTEYVERSDVGVSLTVKLTRGTGTRDQDKIEAKVKANTDELYSLSTEPLIHYRGSSANAVSNNALVRERDYTQRWMTETSHSSVKRVT